MSPTILHIRNMVCNRCIEVVSQELAALGYTITYLELGEVTIKERVDGEGMEQIRRALGDHGFELIDDRKSQLINRIKTLIISYIHLDKEIPGHINLSQYLSGEIGHDYSSQYGCDTWGVELPWRGEMAIIEMAITKMAGSIKAR